MTNRQRRILEVLLERKEATASEIAEEVQISARTVHRDLNEIRPLLADYGLALATKSGRGIAIQGADGKLSSFQTMLAHFETVTFSSDERKTILLCSLLEASEPIKQFSLAYEVNAAIPTIGRDLDEIEPELNKHGLELVRRRGYGVELAGPESAKRAMIEWLIAEHLDESELLGGRTAEPAQTPTSLQRLLNLAGKEHLLIIERILWDLGEKWPSRLNEQAYMKLLLRLSIAAARMRSGHWLSTAPEDLHSSTESIADQSAAWDDESYSHLLPFLEIFPWVWPRDEQDAAHELLKAAMAEAIEQDENLVRRHTARARTVAVQLVQEAEDKLSIPLLRDHVLLEGLVKHLASRMERLELGESIRNPLLHQIKRDFADLFDLIREAVDKTVKEWQVPDEEVAYLVMHIGASLERMNHLQQVRIMTVCTSGIGSSRLLAARIAKQFPQVTLLGNYSWYEASRIPPKQYDIIVSTVSLPIEQERYVKVSPLLTSEEMERLKLAIGRVSASVVSDTPQAGSPNEPQRDSGDGWERLKQMNAYTSATIEIVEMFKTRQLKLAGKPPTLREVAQAMLEPLASVIGEDDIEPLLQKLLEREQASSQAISGTSIALFHTRTDSIEKPLLALYRLTAPLRLGADGEHEVRNILLMLAPMQLSRVTLEILSEISAMLLEPDFIRLLEAGSEDAIKLYISKDMETYIQSKWKGRDNHDYFK